MLWAAFSHGHPPTSTLHKQPQNFPSPNPPPLNLATIKQRPNTISKAHGEKQRCRLLKPAPILPNTAPSTPRSSSNPPRSSTPSTHSSYTHRSRSSHPYARIASVPARRARVPAVTPHTTATPAASKLPGRPSTPKNARPSNNASWVPEQAPISPPP